MVATRTVRLIDHPPHRPPAVGKLIQSIIATLGKQMGQWLEPTYEPTIRKGCDRHGHAYWEVYDPNTKRTMFCMSEAEVGLWLDHYVCRR